MATFTTSGGPVGLYPYQSFPSRDIVPDALVFSLSTVADDLEGDAPSIRVPYVSADPSVTFVAEAAEIVPNKGTISEVLVRSAKLALISQQSMESARSMDASTLVADSMSHAVTVKANQAFLANPDTTASSPWACWRCPASRSAASSRRPRVWRH